MLMTYGEYRRLEKLRRARRVKRALGYCATIICVGVGVGVAMAMLWLIVALL